MKRLILKNCVHSDSSIWNHVIILISLFLVHVIFNFCFVLSRSPAWGQARTLVWECDEYLKYLFYPYDLVSFSSVFMLNKCPNDLKVNTYDQVIHLVELCKIGGKTAIEVAGEATKFGCVQTSDELLFHQAIYRWILHFKSFPGIPRTPKLEFYQRSYASSKT